MKKSFAVTLVVILLISLLFSSCKFDAERVTELSKNALNALSENDYDTFSAQFLPDAFSNDPQSSKKFETLHTIFSGMPEKMKMNSFQTKTMALTTENVKTITSVEYSVITSDGTYTVTVTYHLLFDGSDGLASLYITL